VKTVSGKLVRHSLA